MNPILIDTSAYAALKRGQAEALEIARFAPSIAVNTVVLGEILAGISRGSREAVNRRELAEFLNAPRGALNDPARKSPPGPSWACRPPDSKAIAAARARPCFDCPTSLLAECRQLVGNVPDLLLGIYFQ